MPGAREGEIFIGRWWNAVYPSLILHKSELQLLKSTLHELKRTKRKCSRALESQTRKEAFSECDVGFLCSTAAQEFRNSSLVLRYLRPMVKLLSPPSWHASASVTSTVQAAVLGNNLETCVQMQCACLWGNTRSYLCEKYWLVNIRSFVQIKESAKNQEGTTELGIGSRLRAVCTSQQYEICWVLSLL